MGDRRRFQRILSYLHDSWVKTESAHYYFLYPLALTWGECVKEAATVSEHAGVEVSIVDVGTSCTYLPWHVCSELAYQSTRTAT